MSTQIFDTIFTKNHAETIDLVNDALVSKAYDIIQQRKVTVAQNVFTTTDSEEEE
jgi:hypothetical protein